MCLIKSPYQNSEGVYPIIMDNGCNFISILYLSARHDCLIYTAMDANQIYEQAIKKNMMNKNCLVTYAGKLFTYLTGRLCAFRHEKPDYDCDESSEWLELEILHYRSKRYGDHFLPGDGTGIIEWDPWLGGSMVTKDQNKILVKKNIFRVMK